MKNGTTTMTNLEVKGLLECLDEFTQANTSLSPQSWFTLSKNRKALVLADKDIESARIELVKKHGEKVNGSDEVAVTPNNIDSFKKEYAELLTLTSTLSLSKLKLIDLESNMPTLKGVKNIYLFFDYMTKEK